MRYIFRFPEDPQIRNIWIKVIGRRIDDSWNWSSIKRVCALHFEAHLMYNHPSSNKKFLEQNSIPTLYLRYEGNTSSGSATATVVSSSSNLGSPQKAVQSVQTDILSSQVSLRDILY